MGRESVTVRMLTPKRTLTPEILNDLYVASGHEGIYPTLEDIDKLPIYKPGIVEIFIDSVYDDEPIDKAIKKHDLAVLLESGASYDGPASTYMHVPSTSKHYNGRLHNVDLDYYNSPFVPLSALRSIYTRFGTDPSRMTKNECENMINEIHEVILANTPDPNGVLDEFAFETKLGRDSSKTFEIQEVLNKLDKGLITSDQAMEQIKVIKEG